MKATILRNGADLPTESGVDDNDPLSLCQVLTSKIENFNTGKRLFDPHIGRNFADLGGGLILSNKNYSSQGVLDYIRTEGGKSKHMTFFQGIFCKGA